jgi:hypothetical protein
LVDDVWKVSGTATNGTEIVNYQTMTNALASYVPTNRTIAINGQTNDLSADVSVNTTNVTGAFRVYNGTTYPVAIGMLAGNTNYMLLSFDNDLTSGLVGIASEGTLMAYRGATHAFANIGGSVTYGTFSAAGLNMAGLAITNATYYGNGAGLTNLPNDAWSLAYVVAPVSGTATVSRTFSGTYYSEFVTLLTNQTALNIDTSTFPTNGGATFAWSVNPNGQTISANYASIDSNSWVALTLVTNAYNDLIFRKAPYATTFKVQGE